MLINALLTSAQQTPNYVQYIFGKSVVNPAASGTSINQKVYYMFGANRQWFQLDNSPKQTFAHFTYNIRPQRSYSHWHNVGVMVERDQSGVMANNGFYLNYTLHLSLRRNLYFSFGVFAGVRQFLLSPGPIDPNDPVLRDSKYSTFAYPDLIPGFRLHSKKFFLDISARQVSVMRQRDHFSGRQVASGSYLNPMFFIAYGQVVPVSDQWLALPSVALAQQMVGVPALSPSVMFYYQRRFGAGTSLRNLDLASAIVQFRIWQNLSVGLAYSYTLNRFSTAAPNSYEIMIGATPVGLSEKHVGKHSIAKCPVMDF